MKQSYHYGQAVSPDDWYEEDDNKDTDTALPAAAGDCSPRSNYRHTAAFVPQSELYEGKEYTQQKIVRQTLSYQP